MDRGHEPLDERLVRVALDLIAESGLENLTLRSIARRAGVSHGAPLRHFASLSDLRSEVAARGFRLLREAMEKSGAQLAPGAGPMARMREGARAYVECAVEHPGLFALMFRPEDLDLTNSSFQEQAGGAFDQLLLHVRAAQDVGWHGDRDTRVLAGSVWAAVHGLAMLWSQGAFAGPVPQASLEDAVTMTLDLFAGPPGGHGS